MKKALLLIIAAATVVVAQNKETTFGIGFSGFVKTDVMLDSRQTVTSRENHFLFYPAAEQLDATGEDINKQTSLNLLSIQTRLTGKITGPDAFGAKTSGMIEGAFFGNSDGDVNGFRLRHAFVKLDWENTSLLFGQFWHPLFNTDVFPGVVSFNTGVPFQPFSRNPQIRVTQKFSNVEAAFVVASQRDFTSTGPAGAGSVYLRNSTLPILSFSLKYKNGTTVVGASSEFKSLMPQISTTKKYKTDERVNSYAFSGFAKFSIEAVTLKVHGLYGSNLTDLLMLGGYAVSSVDTTTGIQQYTPSSAASFWGDVSFGKNVAFGLFAGYTKNLGTVDEIKGAYYGRGSNIDNVVRVSPRIEFNSGSTRFSTEVEYTAAAYGKTDQLGKVNDAKTVANIRLLLAAYYFF